MKNSDPIGIFDSGVGGLTVVKTLLQQLPGESFIYFGDTANVPYGNKTSEQLFSYAHKIISFLMDRQVKAVVVACGTHSSVTLPVLQENYHVPMLGVVIPGSIAAASSTRNGKIGIMATQATVNTQAYTRYIKHISPDAQVFETACTRLVPLVEAGFLEGPETILALKEYITPLLDQGIDTLVMGCTHYPFLAPVIQGLVGEGVKLVDPACETVSGLGKILGVRSLLATDDNPTREFYVSGNDESFYNVGKLLIGDFIQTVEKISLD